MHYTLQGTSGLWYCMLEVCGWVVGGQNGPSRSQASPGLPLRLTSCTRQRGSGQGETWRRRGISYLYRAPCELPYSIKYILSLLLSFVFVFFIFFFFSAKESNQKKRTFFRLDPFQIMTQAENIVRLCAWSIQLFPISFTGGAQQILSVARSVSVW